MDLVLTLTHPELQRWGSSESTETQGKELNCLASGHRMEAGPDRVLAGGTAPLLGPPNLEPNLSLHQTS